MALSPLAGKPAPPEMLIDPAGIENAYYVRRPDLDDPNQLVSFGTSGHRGSPVHGSFTETHILAVTQAICDYRQRRDIDGPLYMGKDTHALSGPAQRTAVEVLAANGVETILQENDGVTPTPVISRAILVYNRERGNHLADGIVVTPSHNPPEDGGFKYNPPNGGPADTDVTKWIQDRANELMRKNNAGVKRLSVCRGHEGGHHASARSYPSLCERPSKRHRHGGDPKRRHQDRRGSARRLFRTLLGADPRRVPRGYHCRECKGGSNLFVHERRSRRQDPHGLLQPLCHGKPCQSEGPVSDRLCQ